MYIVYLEEGADGEEWEDARKVEEDSGQADRQRVGQKDAHVTPGHYSRLKYAALFTLFDSVADADQHNFPNFFVG